MTSPVPTPGASGSLTDMVPVMCASPVVTFTDVGVTLNAVRVGRTSALAGPTPAMSAAAAASATVAGSRIDRRTDAGLITEGLDMRTNPPGVTGRRHAVRHVSLARPADAALKSL